MRILFLTQVLPYPLDAGPKVRAYYTLRHLARRHEVALLSFVRGSDTQQSIDHLRQFCSMVRTVPIRRSKARDLWHLIQSLHTGHPFLAIRDHVPQMRSAVQEMVEQYGPFQVVHADQLWMAPYALIAREAAGQEGGPYAILDQHNAVFRVAERLAQTDPNRLRRILWRMETPKLKAYEARMCHSFDRVVWVAQEDEEAMSVIRSPRADGRRQAVIPIAIEPEHEPIKRDACHRVTFIGSLHWPPNAEGILWFREHVWPLVRSAVPSACLTVLGHQAQRVVKSNAADGVESVSSSNLKPYLRETSVCVVPLLSGAGMRVKILDAWAWGLPVVITHVGADGLPARNEGDLLLADSAQDFAAAVVRILKEPSLASRLAAEGRRTVKSLYDWRQAYRAWDELYECASSSSFHTHPA